MRIADRARIESLYSLDKPERFILALVEFGQGKTKQVRCLTSVNYDLAELIARSSPPG